MNDIEINEILKNYTKFLSRSNYIYFKKKNNSKLHPLATAKLNTVAVRFPKHKIIRTILKEIDFPLAMPSANKSTNVSPVSAKMSLMNLKKKFNLL